MSIPFEPLTGLIIVRAELEGPSGSAVLRLALDTVQRATLVNAGMHWQRALSLCHVSH